MITKYSVQDTILKKMTEILACTSFLDDDGYDDSLILYNLSAAWCNLTSMNEEDKENGSNSTESTN